MADHKPYPQLLPATFASQSLQLEQLAGAAEQQQASPDPQEFATTPQRPPNPRKRRADGSSVSSRGVANLTPDQLAKKRANDRDAQRAIRERTKLTIEKLERRIKEFESQQPFQDLQTAIRSKDVVLAENEDLKRRLASIVSLAQFQPGAAGLNDLALATSQQSPLPTSNNAHQPDQHGQQSQQQDYPETPFDHSEHPPTASQHHLDPELRGSQSQQHAPTASMQSANGDSLSPHTHGRSNKSSPHNPSQLPSHTPSTNALDTAIFDLVASGRAAIGGGKSAQEALGPADPSFAYLVEEGAEGRTESLSVSVAQLVLEHSGTTDLSKRVAVMYAAYHLIRWLISPTEESFALLPSWLRPTELQTSKPHPVWMDLLPWSQLREKAIQSQAQYSLAFLQSTISGLSLDWPYPSKLCLISLPTSNASEGSVDWGINPVFEAHILEAENWTLALGSGHVEPPGSNDAGVSHGSHANGIDDQDLEGLLQGFSPSHR